MGRLVGASAKFAAVIAAATMLAGCAGEGSQGVVYTQDRGVANQPYPADYRTQLLAFFKTYLNNAVGVRDAGVAVPIQRTVGGRLRYVACVRYNAPEANGSYHGAVERAVVFVDARLDHVENEIGDICAGAVYAPFPEMEQMTR